MTNNYSEDNPRMKTKHTTRNIAVALCLSIAFLMLLIPTAALAVDDENCLMCHKYAGLGRYAKNEEQKAIKRIFYVNEELFRASFHGKLRCKSCHSGVEEIPHTDVKQVDCATDCHLNDPSTGRDFSHKSIVDDLKKSAHGADGAKSPELIKDLPTCKDCHTNKPYQLGVDEEVESMRFIKVCLECHESEAWTNRFYKHMFYRAHTRRSSKQVVALCSQCHANKEKMDRHDIDVVIGFKDTFHAKAILYGAEDVANCLNCHAPYQMGFSPHRILSRTDSSSPIHPNNKLDNCRQAGCHADAQEAFASKGKAHPSNVIVERVDEDGIVISQEEQKFQAWVLNMIELFYKILIVVVVGGLGFHRLADLYATHRERKIAFRAAKSGRHPS
ncbi:MAG: hypothetical protein L3J26_00325 [Candidatus Polarisedimenticolaceae bacterium]|nr:hypothetical protein [Candidatus Polarisedimenticolaceae bacterium]